MNEILAMAFKDIRLIFRDKPALFFVVGFPFIYATLLGFIFSGMQTETRSIEVVAVDEDETNASRAFIAALGNLEQIDLIYADHAAATDRVRRSQSVAYVRVPEGFAEHSANLFIGTPPEVELGTDPMRRAESAMLQGMLTELAFRERAKSLNDPEATHEATGAGAKQLADTPDGVAKTREFFAALTTLRTLSEDAGSGDSPMFTPLRITTTEVANKPDPGDETPEGLTSAFQFSFPQGLVWAVLICFARFSASLAYERNRGTLMRMQTAPVTKAQIVAGKAVGCFIMIMALALALFAFAYLAFDVRPASVPMLGVALVCVALCFVGIMVLVSTLGQTESAAEGLGSAIMIVMAMTGGGMVPLMVMPDWMRAIGSVSPVKWAILAVEGTIWRGFTPSEMLLPCGILLAIGAVCFAIGAKAFRWATA